MRPGARQRRRARVQTLRRARLLSPAEKWYPSGVLEVVENGAR